MPTAKNQKLDAAGWQPDPRVIVAVVAALAGAVTYMASYGGLDVAIAWVAGIAAGALLHKLKAMLA